MVIAPIKTSLIKCKKQMGMRQNVPYKTNFRGDINPNLINYQYRLQSAKMLNQQTVSPIKEEDGKNDKQKALKISASILGLGALGIALVAYKKKNCTEIFDIDYKKQLLNSLGISKGNVNKLKSIAGKEELLDFLSKNQDDQTFFSVGENFLNVKNKDFGANLHIHTTNSDGQMTVQDLLDLSSRYADKYYKKHKKPFFIAITDHNTLNGDREAVDIIFKNPEKYKNLRVVLGSEINAMSDETELHTLIYGINPFKSAINDKLGSMLDEHTKIIKEVISKANKIYEDITKKYNFEFSFDDMAKTRPSIKYGPCNVNYSMKDYMQFRSIFGDVVENNPKLTGFLKSNNIELESLDFSIPKKTINQNNPKMPYYLNYEDELYKYIEKIYQEKTGSYDFEELRKCYKKISPDIKNVLDELEYKTINKDEPLYCKNIKNGTLEEVLDLYSREPDSVCAIAHPCLTYNKGKSNPDTKEGRERLECVFKLFDKKIKTPKISESYYQAYYKSNMTDDWRNYAKKLAQENNFLHSGSYDSHENTPFANKDFLTTETIQELVN